MKSRPILTLPASFTDRDINGLGGVSEWQAARWRDLIHAQGGRRSWSKAGAGITTPYDPMPR